MDAKYPQYPSPQNQYPSQNQYPQQNLYPQFPPQHQQQQQQQQPPIVVNVPATDYTGFEQTSPVYSGAPCPNCRIGTLQKQCDDWVICLDCIFCLGTFSCCCGINKKKCSNCGKTYSSSNGC